jgi:3-hydroxyisobutyrate dehydrogenase-like beta-hydroxyacid dehydrogenase
MPTPSPITVLGLGPMGQAMTRALIGNGHAVTVWNRTSSRTEGVVAAGARLAETPAEAVAASDLIILSLTDYQAMWNILGDATAPLAGRVLVNLSSDTPGRTREAATWAGSQGATFLAGGVMVPAPMVGTDLSYVYYSGDEAAFNAYRGTLAHIGEPRFLGDDPGRAQLMYQAHLDVFLTTLSGFAHATALVGSAGITAATFLPEVLQLFEAIPDMIAADGIEALGERIDAGEHPGEGSTNIMMSATADHIVAASKSAGIDSALPRAVQAQYRRALDEGYGTEGWTRIIDGIRAPRPGA